MSIVSSLLVVSVEVFPTASVTVAVTLYVWLAVSAASVADQLPPVVLALLKLKVWPPTVTVMVSVDAAPEPFANAAPEPVVPEIVGVTLFELTVATLGTDGTNVSSRNVRGDDAPPPVTVAVMDLLPSAPS